MVSSSSSSNNKASINLTSSSIMVTNMGCNSNVSSSGSS